MASHRSLPQGTDSVVNGELKCLVDNTSDFCCCSQASGVISKHPLPKLRSWRFTPVFSSKNVRVLALTPGPLVHPGCVFVHAVSRNPASLFCTWYPVVPASVWTRDSSRCMALEHLWNSVAHRRRVCFRLSVPVYGHTCLSCVRATLSWFWLLCSKFWNGEM